jgi:hypothetical protein
VIISDPCGSLGPYTAVRHSGVAEFTATATGPLLLSVENWRSGSYTALVKNYVDDIRVFPLQEDFSAAPREISCATGGSSQLALNPGLDHAGDAYIILSGASGTWPGFSISAVEIPLNLDDWTWCALILINTPVMKDFMGQLDLTGFATAEIDTGGALSPEMIGQVLYFEYLVLEKAFAPPVKKASQPIHILFIP